MGFLGRDAEARFTPNGVAVATFSVATTQSWKDRDSGEWKDKSTWHNVVLWRKENLHEKLVKGALVYVEGRSETRKYTDKNGQERYVTELIADDVAVIPYSKSEWGQGGGDRSMASEPRRNQQQGMRKGQPVGSDNGFPDFDGPLDFNDDDMDVPF
jgi:single-strand DNA-binding protein